MKLLHSRPKYSLPAPVRTSWIKALFLMVLFGMLPGTASPAWAELPLEVAVRSGAVLVVEEVVITQHKGYSMLRIRGRWKGDDLSLDYRVRPALEGIKHAESEQGLVWYVGRIRPIEDKSSDGLFSMDIKNPPANFETLKIKVNFKPQADKPVGEQDPVEFTLSRKDVGQQKVDGQK